MLPLLLPHQAVPALAGPGLVLVSANPKPGPPGVLGQACYSTALRCPLYGTKQCQAHCIITMHCTVPSLHTVPVVKTAAALDPAARLGPAAPGREI